MDKLWILDDGTLDTVVTDGHMRWRYSSDYRFSFESDDDFLAEIEPTLDYEF